MYLAANGVFNVNNSGLLVRRYTSISAVIDILRRKKLPLLDPQSWDDRNDRHFMTLYKESKRLGGIYGLCAAACPETYHHWRVFTNSADGACLEIRREPLENSLKKVSGVRFGIVEYLKLDQVESLTKSDVGRLPFVKRAGFSAEAEYRIIAEKTEDQETAFSVKFPVSMINCIYLNPWLPKTIVQSLKTTLQSLPGCSNVRVSRSLLIDSARWKEAGNKVAGKISQA